ncbi:hypothetical protein ACQ0MK_16585 [Thalassospira lucentensis]|uniref:hypothetical protein n=1 Tax=Thalassospira lucentensis TaxID=168935 RepID=UPI003D2EF0F4
MNDDEKSGVHFALATPSPTHFPIFGDMSRFYKENLMGLSKSRFVRVSPNWFAEFML